MKPTQTSVVDGPKESRVQAWSLTMILVLLYVINAADKAVLGLVAQPLAHELGLTSSQIGLVGSGFFLTFTVSGFFAGLLNKWVTLRWILVLLSLAWAATMVPMVLVASFTVLLVSRLALGLAEGPSSALVHTAVYSWHAPKKRGLPGAWIASGVSIAKIAIAPALAVVVATWGWRAALVTLAVAGVAWCALWLATWKEGPYGERGQADTASTAEGEEPQPAVPWTKIFFTPTFLGAAVAVISVYALVSVVLTFLPSYFEVGLGYSRLEAGTMFGFPSIASMAALLVSTFISDRLLSRGASSRLLRGVLPGTGLLICGLAMTTLPYIGAPGLTVGVVSVGYGFGTVIMPLFNAAISQLCPPRQLAGTLGVFLALMSLGGLVAPYLTGVIVDAASSPAEGYASAFKVFGIAAVVTSLIALLTVNPERDASRVLG
ncbi:Sugar phosphate permease [Streptomyces melanosporofaciens]|uniref:Sugar phosphate permease n=1 Tax=Streptomyces melanosporofaciens TaxID=67327 RepID=A0A1H4KL40_STRMJ|nr:Sugar phosphate permease [Streptomyces melanosporofaciens]